MLKLHLLNTVDDDIDTLAKQIKPLKDMIKPSSSVGFYNNYDEKGSYFQTQFLLAPEVVLKNISENATHLPDTIIVIQKVYGMPATFNSYKIATQSVYNNRIISLITKSGK